LKSLVACAALLALGACTTHRTAELRAPRPTQPASSGPSSSTLAYANETASAHLFQIQAAEIALQRSRDPAVSNFAQMLLNDNRALLQRTSLAIEGARIPVAAPLLQQNHFALAQQLQMATAARFDDTFRNIEVMALMQSIDLQQRYSLNGDNAALRGLANEMIPTLHAHLAAAQNIHIAPIPQYRPRISPGERG